MSERHPNIKCLTTWCEYWVKVFEGDRGEKIGGCDAWDLLISTVSGEDTPTCRSYKGQSFAERQRCISSTPKERK